MVFFKSVQTVILLNMSVHLFIMFEIKGELSLEILFCKTYAKQN